MQVVVTNGSTSFERLHGVPANTSKQLLSAGKVTFEDMRSALEDADLKDRKRPTCDGRNTQQMSKAD